MKIYVMVDLEGISGVSGKSYINSSLGRPDLIAKAREFMAADINACVEGCFKGGATEVIVKDCHGGGGNVTRDLIDERADLIDGDTPGIRFADMDGSDGLILLGYHAMAGTRAAVLEHTMSSAGWHNVWLNGRKAGETAIDAAIAAEHSVPVVMVSGDDKLCIEADDWIPGVVTCPVKKAFSCNGARMPSLEKAHVLIMEKAEEAVRKCGKIAPLQLKYPVKYRIELVERQRLPDNAACRIIDGRTFELESDTVEKALFFNW